MFVFVFVCYYSVMWFEFSNSEGLSLLSNVLVRYCLIVFLLCYHNSAGLPLLLDCLLTHLFLFIIWKSLWYDSVSQHVDTALHILYILRIWILQDHVTACVQFSMIFLFSVLFSSLFVIVFVWQGTHYWWWLSPLSRLVLRVETLVVFIRMFVFVFVCYYSVVWFEFPTLKVLVF